VPHGDELRLAGECEAVAVGFSYRAPEPGGASRVFRRISQNRAHFRSIQCVSGAV
jgi:hypothetical protein